MKPMKGLERYNFQELRLVVVCEVKTCILLQSFLERCNTKMAKKDQPRTGSSKKKKCPSIRQKDFTNERKYD